MLIDSYICLRPLRRTGRTAKKRRYEESDDDDDDDDDDDPIDEDDNASIGSASVKASRTNDLKSPDNAVESSVNDALSEDEDRPGRGARTRAKVIKLSSLFDV